MDKERQRTTRFRNLGNIWVWLHMCEGTPETNKTTSATNSGAGPLAYRLVLTAIPCVSVISRAAYRPRPKLVISDYAACSPGNDPVTGDTYHGHKWQVESARFQRTDPFSSPRIGSGGEKRASRTAGQRSAMAVGSQCGDDRRCTRTRHGA